MKTIAIAAMVLALAATAKANQFCDSVNIIRNHRNLAPITCKTDEVLSDILKNEMIPENAVFRSSAKYPDVKFRVWSNPLTAINSGCGSQCRFRTTQADAADGLAAAEEQYPEYIQPRSGLFDRQAGIFSVVIGVVKDKRVILIRKK